MKLHFIIGIFFLLTTATVVTNGKILTERPSFLTGCAVDDASFGECFAKELTSMLKEWKSGVPGLESFGSLDPLKVKRISMDQDTGTGPIGVKATLTDIEMNWLNNIAIKDVHFDSKKLVMKFQLTIPLIESNANYEMKGHILNLILDGKGKSYVKMDNTVCNIALRFKLRKDGEYIFTDIDKLRLEIESATGIKMKLDNLFGGDKALEDGAHAIFNDSWQSLFEFGRPFMGEAFGAVLKERFGKIFAYVPGTYFFDGLPSVA